MADYLIVGVTGQDGALLARLLLAKGYSVAGTHRRFSDSSFWRLEEMGIAGSIDFYEYDIGSPAVLYRILSSVSPKAVFFVAGDSYTASSANSASRLMEVNVVGCAEQVEAMRALAPDVPAVFFMSSEIFGYQKNPGILCDEETKREASNPYGISKAAAQDLISYYRREEGLPFFDAILFPHESPWRSPNFLVRKVVRNVCKWSVAPADFRVPLYGSLTSTRDWGSAEQYMGWIFQMVEKASPGSYVLATGVSHNIQDVFAQAGDALGRNFVLAEDEEGQSIVDDSSGSILARAARRKLANEGHGPIGNTNLLSKQIRLGAKVPFSDVVNEMVDAELKRVSAR